MNGCVPSQQARVVCKKLKNHALGMPTTQSSTAYGGVSSRAVDGNTSGVWSEGSVTHTPEMRNPYWYVELQSVVTIGTINVYNREDYGSQERLTGFKVVIWNGSSAVWTYTDTGGTPGRVTSIDVPNVDGDKVQVKLEGDKRTLSLAEVEVFEHR